MGYFDDMTYLFGRGMNAMDKKTQEFRLQSDLGRVETDLESAYAALGKAVFDHPSLTAAVRHDCPRECDDVATLLQVRADICQRIDDLRRQAAAAYAPVPRQEGWLSCPRCNAPVTLDLSYCSNCGDNLANLKRHYRVCPACGRYYGEDSLFCIQDGGRTAELPVAPPLGPGSATVWSAQGAAAATMSPVKEGGGMSHVETTAPVPGSAEEKDVRGVVAPPPGPSGGDLGARCDDSGLPVSGLDGEEVAQADAPVFPGPSGDGRSDTSGDDPMATVTGAVGAGRLRGATFGLEQTKNVVDEEGAKAES